MPDTILAIEKKDILFWRLPKKVTYLKDYLLQFGMTSRKLTLLENTITSSFVEGIGLF